MRRSYPDGRYATGFQLKSKVENGTDPIVEYFRKGSAASHLSVEDYHEDYFASARHLHLSGVAAALSASSYELLAHTARTLKARGRPSRSTQICVRYCGKAKPKWWKTELAGIPC